MNSLPKVSADMELEELNLADLDDDVAFRLTFAPREDDAQPEPLRYAVIFRHQDFADQLLVIESGSGAPGIALFEGKAPKISIADVIHLRWNSKFCGWQIEGMVIRIERIMEGRELPSPLKEQLGMTVMPPAQHRRNRDPWKGW